MTHTPGQPATCEVCGTTMPWVKREIPHLSDWYCPLHQAAPDLLEALEAILSIPADQDGDILLPTRADSYFETQDHALFEPFNKARAAIQKARES